MRKKKCQTRKKIGCSIKNQKHKKNNSRKCHSILINNNFISNDCSSDSESDKTTSVSSDSDSESDKTTSVSSDSDSESDKITSDSSGSDSESDKTTSDLVQPTILIDSSELKNKINDSLTDSLNIDTSNNTISN